jgi:lysozyme family protein
MADPVKAFEYVMGHEDPKREGKVVPDPTEQDPNAVARFGVNSAAHPEMIAEGFFGPHEGIDEMPRQDALDAAARLFQYRYFSPMGGYQIRDQDVCNKVVDIAYEAGCEESIKIVQRAANSIDAAKPALEIDGKLGSKTMNAINFATSIQLLAAIKSYASDFYRAWAFRLNKPDGELQAILRRVND